jgi:hypothetical protein
MELSLGQKAQYLITDINPLWQPGETKILKNGRVKVYIKPVR